MEFKIVVNKSEHDRIVALLRVNGVKFAKGKKKIDENEEKEEVGKCGK